MKRTLYAVSDLHGCLTETFLAFQAADLIDNFTNWCMPDCTLVICGDYIDRGPNSRQLVDNIRLWQSQAIAFGSNLVLLLGNHEAMMLMGVTNKEAGDTWYGDFCGGKETLKSYGVGIGTHYVPRHTVEIMKVHKDFYLNLESYHVQNDVLFVHAGVPPNYKLHHLDSTQAHLWMNPPQFVDMDPYYLRTQYNVGRVVFGHTIFTDGIRSFNNGTYLGIDTGSYKHNGRITVVKLTADSFEVTGTS